MKRVSQILGSEHSTILKLIINWTEIAGVSNRELMIPVDIRDRTLIIVVPNGMVAKTFVRFKNQLLSNIGNIVRNSGISDIKFIVDTTRFKEKKPVKTDPENIAPDLSPEEILKKKHELESKGISPAIAESMARIELIWQKKK
ncbi:MAG TPA: DciA family protein [bacterium]|nr:DciA family protein [bacterium]HPS30664.1 DciA family protein [bacterium]